MGSAVGHFINAQGQLELTAAEKKEQMEEERFAAYDARNGGARCTLLRPCTRPSSAAVPRPRA